jgi:nitrogen fixation-related uncharacterized protein
MWFSAVNELLMFCFGMASLWCWLRKRDALSAVLLALALVSKESAIVLLPLVLLTDPPRWKRLAPHAVLAALAVASVLESLPLSRWQLFAWRAVLDHVAAEPRTPTVVLGLAGIAIWLARDRWALVPYSFLTYSTQIPSRQTYLAGAGLAMLAGVAAASLPGRRAAAIAIVLVLATNVGYLWTKKRAQFEERAEPTAHAAFSPTRRKSPVARLIWRVRVCRCWSGFAAASPPGRRVAAIAIDLMLATNVGYLWAKKRAQFEEHADPTAQLIAFAGRTHGRIWMRCFPLPKVVGEEAVRLSAGPQPESLVWSPTEGSAEFCYQPLH